MNKYPGITKIIGKNGTTYLVRYRTLNGKQKAKTFKRLEDAKAFKANTDSARRAGGVVPGTADKILFADFAADWAANKSHRSTTIRRRDGILSKYVIPELGDLPLSKIRHSMLQDLVDKWTAAGLSPYTIRNHVNILRPILGRAVKDELIVRNPTDGVELPKVLKEEPRSLSPAECRFLLATVDPDFGPVIETLLATGLRWKELESLNMEDFDRNARTLRVTESKTQAGARTVSLDEVDALIIVKHLMSTGRIAASPKGPLFTSPHGERLNYSNFRSRVFIPAAKAAGLTDVTIHSLRRTHATMLISAGHNAKAVQYRMGHASIETTLSYYASATPEDRLSTATAKSVYLAATQTGLPAETT